MQILYIGNEMERVLGICKHAAGRDPTMASRELLTTLDQCLQVMNAHSGASKNKILKITSTMTDPPIPPELSLQLHIHKDSLVMECIWSQDKKSLLLTVPLPPWPDLQSLYAELRRSHSLLSHLLQ